MIIRPFLALMVALILAFFFGAAIASSANAAVPPTPYPSGSSSHSIGGSLTLNLSSSTPDEGARLTAGGTGADPGETVSFTLHSKAYPLGTTTAGASGAFSFEVQLPAGVSGSHVISARGTTSGLSTQRSIEISPATEASSATTTSSSDGGLSSTGVAVVGLGAVGLVLVMGGGLVLLAGRRRRVHV